MVTGRQSEFDVDVVASHYEAITDTFIDVRQAARTLAAQIAPCRDVFEIGLGNGYFAQQLTDIGIAVEGIQPRDGLLEGLKTRRPHIRVRAECRLEEYAFEKSYDVIVSHSSVFLCTRHSLGGTGSGETRRFINFQSFILDYREMLANLRRVLAALSPRGRLFVNIQNNPRTSVVVGEPGAEVRFNMASCEYDVDRRVVTKQFLVEHSGSTTRIVDKRLFCPLVDLRSLLEQEGTQVDVLDNDEWIVFRGSRQ